VINRVILVGRMTKDPQIRKTQTGKSVTSFTVAVNRRSSQQDQTDFINCVAWERTAEVTAQYAKKGSLVGVEGRLTSRSYDDATGKRVYVTEVLCDSVQFLESKAASEQRPQQTTAQQSGYYPDSNGSLQDDDFNTGPLLDISSDDLPF